MDLTLEQIESEFNLGRLSAEEAVKYLQKFFKGKSKLKAERLLDKVLGMSSEPATMTADQKVLAKAWWDNNHG